LTWVRNIQEAGASFFSAVSGSIGGADGLLPIHTERSGGEEGFSLVEIVVALAILSLSLGILLSVISDGIRRADQAKRMDEAESMGQSLLARVGAELPLGQGQTTGEFGNGFHWRLTIEAYGDRTDRMQQPLGAYTISAEVLWNNGFEERSVVLKTLRLGAKQPEP
jgi:general secretion pathway protein I